ncbi:porin [Burkholderia lata]|uniref:Porin n=1 Tax=Burkholderia lata (strain ATCC 17760 / DSM 23089 / LMG 22485 / NCIMB 9086 / R18194 / 383) TaxID=482957 RepID=A0A6P2Q9V2_BURL3|nr:porin [Burkholderia lata]VWC16670.1 porin [Burkholderia lata]
MNEKLWRAVGLTAALSVAGFGLAASARAQSSVTLYGVLDANMLYTSKTLNVATGGNGGKQFSLQDGGWSGSRFGLTGTEDLGGGMRAIFKLESGISVTNGGFNNSNGNLFGRLAWVGIDSPYGTVTAGLQYSPFFIAVDHLDPRGMSEFGSNIINYGANVLATGIATPNSIVYTSPRIDGLKVRALYSFGNVPGSFQAGRAYSGSLDYEIGSLTTDMAIFDSNGGSQLNTPIPSTMQFEGRVFGLGYHLGPVTVKASFANYKVAGGFNSNVYGGGLAYFAASDVTLNAGVQYTSDRNDKKNHSLLASLGAQYLISRRTSLYAQVGFVNNHGAMNTGLAINGAVFLPAGNTFGADIGIRHSF